MELWQLRQLQKLPLDGKVFRAIAAISDFNERFRTCVAFSGGLDSTVLLDLVRSVYPDTLAVHNNTRQEYTGIEAFVRSLENVHITTPSMTFPEVIEKWGYPIPSKKVAHFVEQVRHPTDKNQGTINLRLTGMDAEGRYRPNFRIPRKWLPLITAPFEVSDRCCQELKHKPLERFYAQSGLRPFIGTLASDSEIRERQYLRQRCNIFEGNPRSMPLSIWTSEDVLQYILKKNLPYAKSVYGDIIEGSDGKLTTTLEKHTGCMFCMFGIHLEPHPNRFQRLEYNNPRLWDYCINRLGCGRVLDYIATDYRWRDTATPNLLLR